jgi:uncharacterized membrane protein YkoI
MKIKLLVCSAIAAGLLTGCINIKVQCPCGHNSGKNEECEKHGDKEKGEKGEKGEQEKREKGEKEKGEGKNKEADQAKLMAQAKVSKETAQQTALAKVPNGTIKEGELEQEKGKLQWSFDVATPGTTDITEVNIDAMTGDVISMDKESAADEAKEAAEESGKSKKSGKDEDKD